MKKFFFRLETLLKVRKAREGRTQRELAYTQQKWTQLKEKRDSIKTQISSLMEEIRVKRKRKEYGLEETYSQLLDHLNTSFAQIEEALELQEKQVQEKREQLKQVIRERKVIEKIKEKHYTQWRIQAEQSEGNLLDEQPYSK
ncbi:MAG: flagellar FliJ family protein [Chlamydiales bacterium]|nr:flagellar FliJ family protein [Chlamydiales bacterium]